MTTSQRYLKKLISLGEVCFDVDTEENEFLYGRIGYLSALLFVVHNLPQESFQDVKKLIKKLFSLIIRLGKEFSKSEKSKSPLMYEWHDSRYLGGAHGLTGILYVLLEALPYVQPTEEEMSLIKASLRYLATERLANGNYPTREGATKDTLLQFCHGATTFVLLFCKAAQLFADKELLEIAEKSGDFIWERGVLIKGPGLCHGVAGNGYALLALYKATKKELYLLRALRFAQITWDEGFIKEVFELRKGPDYPYSLYEGWAGTLCYYIDLLRPDSSAFPLFDLD
eukprot:TRINITY_DN5814_c0_g1_i1.p1 TRINITY_DN5814_c0_g1~~TRINITY_DN5814_c0_g1_i1.p1  ORF type:complete len:284 (-),score=66.32 TRINITY_DN5814_c0_g1_i1:34-885(-)